jgi:hypothetical protein
MNMIIYVPIADSYEYDNTGSSGGLFEYDYIDPNGGFVCI